MRVFVSQLVSEVRGLPRPVHVLVGGQFINRFGGFVMPFLALYLTSRNIAMGQVALVLGAISIGSLFGPIASGYLADAIGRRNTIVLSLVSAALSTILLYHCETIPQLLIVAFLTGFCSSLYGPAASALLTDLVTEQQRVITFALMRLAVNAGFAAGPAVAGLLFTRSPALIFYGDALTTLVFALLAYHWLPHGLRTVAGRVSALNVIWKSWRAALVDMAHNRPFLILMVASLLMEISFVQTFNVLAIATVDRGLSPAEYGVIMGLNGVLIMFIELPLNQWARRFDLRWVLVIGFAMVSLSCASFGLAHSQGEFFAVMTFFTIGEMLSLPVAMSYASTLAPETFRGRYYGVRGMVWALASMAGSSGVWFYGQWGDTWWYVAGAIGLFGSLLLFVNIMVQTAAQRTPTNGG